MNICPKCQSKFSRLAKGKCPSCRTGLTRIEGLLVLESEKRIPELLLQNYELNVSRVRRQTFYFNRGKERAAQLSYAVNFFNKTKEFLSKQATPISATPESFAFMVMAEIMTDQFCRTTVSIHGLNNFIANACSAVHQSKVAEQKQKALSHSIDLTPKFEVRVF
jgi:hypothetical protein